MKEKSIKFICGILCLTFLAGCSDTQTEVSEITNSEGEVIATETVATEESHEQDTSLPDVWYEETAEVFIDSVDTDSYSANFNCAKDDTIYNFTYGWNSDGTCVCKGLEYSFDGQYIGEIDFTNVVEAVGINSREDTQLSDVIVYEDAIQYIFTVDTMDGMKFYRIKTGATPDVFDSVTEIDAGQFAMEYADCIVTGDRISYMFFCYASDGYHMLVTEKGGESTKIPFNGDNSIKEVSGMCPAGEDKLIVSEPLKLVDLTTGDISSYEGDIKDAIDMESCAYDGKSYFINDAGLVYPDPENNTVTTVADFNSIDFNRTIAKSYSNLVYVDDSRFVLMCYNNITGSMQNPDYNKQYYAIFSKTENPNKSKQIITLGYLEEITFLTSEAVREFNSTNDSYFIKTVDTYCTEATNYDSSDYITDGLTKSAAAQSKLLVDLNAGDAPDIIVGSMGNATFDSDTIFADMSSYVDSSLWLSNVWEATKEDSGALYKIPMSIGLEALMTTEDTGKPGFTFDEYQQFVIDKCYGVDPFMMTSEDFLIKIESSIHDLFTETYDNDAFRTLAQYVATNKSTFDKWEQYDAEMEISGGIFSNVSSLKLYLYDIKYYGTEYIKGFPSSDGRFANLIAGDSVAISANSNYKEICGEFVNLMLSETLQTNYTSTGMPVNEKAFDMKCVNDLADYNDGEQKMSDSIGAMPMDESNVEYFKNAFAQATRFVENDPETMMIVYEEIQPYLEGQKSLDECISIIDNRVSVVKSERS